MIVSPNEYSGLLSRLIDPNEYTDLLRIPTDETLYEVNLNERKINAPEFLSVQEDHNSEIIWFITDRFYDNIDLYDSTCWIQYVNAAKEEYFYHAPILVGVQEYGSEKVLIPWAVGQDVTKSTGVVEFSFQFFKLSEDKLRFLYVLNTQPARSKVLTGLRVNPMDFVTSGGSEEDSDASPESSKLADDLHELTEKYRILSAAYELYWIDVN
jgi:hypothetical protein